MTTKDLSATLGPMVSLATGGFGGSFSNGFNGNGSNGFGGSFSNEDSIPAELLDPEPLFDINFKATKKNYIKKAKLQLILLVSDIVPELYCNMPVIKDKIDLDAELLGNLYYLQYTKDVTYQTLLETIARGETLARMFEVAEKMAKSLEDLAVKITEMQNNMRKYYIDTYLDVQTRIESDDICNTNAPALAASNQPLKLENNNSNNSSKKNNENTYVGTDDLLEHLLAKKKNKYKQNAIDASIIK